jgi:hypothetical protein
MPIFPAIVPKPYDDDAQRQARADANLPISSRRAAAILIAGCLALVAWGVLILLGYPGTGVELVPIGMLLIIGGGIELLLSRL